MITKKTVNFLSTVFQLIALVLFIVFFNHKICGSSMITVLRIIVIVLLSLSLIIKLIKFFNKKER